MRAVLTRVRNARVEVDGKTVGAIDTGFLVLLGVHVDDTEIEAKKIVDRICKMRIFEDERGKFNLSPTDAGAEILLISQFTLYGDCRQRRPGFTKAARPDKAETLYKLCIEECRNNGFKVETGIFGEDMQVYSQNDGPVTLILDTDEL